MGGESWWKGKRRRKQDRNDPANPGVGPVPVPGVSGPIPPVSPATDPFKSIAGGLLGVLSPEDAAALRQYYGVMSPVDERAHPDVVRPGDSINPGGVGSKPITSITADVRNRFLSADRATQALNAVTNALAAAGVTNGGGPGVAFLQNAINLLNQFGGTPGEGMSRLDYNQFNTAVDELFKQAEGNNDITAQYRSLASMFLRPTFSAGSLVDQSTIGGRTFFGRPSRKLYS